MKKWLLLLSIIPTIGSLIVVNRVEPYVLGLPFVLFWMVLWVVITSGCLFWMNAIDPANREEE